MEGGAPRRRGQGPAELAPPFNCTRPLPLKARNSRVASRVPDYFLTLLVFNPFAYGVGRGNGVGRGLGVGGGRVAEGVGVGVIIGVGVTVGVGGGVTGVGVGVAVALGVGVGVPGQLPSTLNTIIMFGNPISCVGVGSFTPQSAALK